LLVSVYHLGRPDLNPVLNPDEDSFDISAPGEVDCFFNKSSNYLIANDRYLKPALDIEGNYGKDWKEIVDWIHVWMEWVKEKANLSENPILYCSKDTAKNLYNADSTITKYPLWIVDYSNNEFPDTSGCPDWDWAFRQYAGHKNAYLAGRGRCPGFAVDAGVDLNIYNSDIEDLKSKFLIQ